MRLRDVAVAVVRSSFMGITQSCGGSIFALRLVVKHTYQQRHDHVVTFGGRFTRERLSGGNTCPLLDETTWARRGHGDGVGYVSFIKVIII